MAIWSKKSKSSNHAPTDNGGMIGGLSVDAHPAERRMARADRAQEAEMTVGDYMNGMPNIRLTSLFKGLMKQILWVMPVFLLGCFVIYTFTKDIKRNYRAEGRLLVQIGPEYIYTPVGTPNNNSGGVSQTPDTIALNEVGIIKNAEIIEYVTGIMTSPTETMTREQAQDLFAKSAFKKISEATDIGSERAKKEALAELYESVGYAFSVAPQPKSSLIDVAFEHENPEIAVRTLDQLIKAYQAKRQVLFVEGAEDTISERRDETERQLKVNERAVARFLERNDISDFTSEQTGLRTRSEGLKAELNTLRGQISETESSLATVEDQLRGTESTINLYVDDRASQRIAQAELELKQLLAKYLPTSNPVRQKRTELGELKSLQSANNGRAAGGRRVGPNPVHQALLTRRNILKSTADSFREKEFTLQGQLNSAVNKVRRLTKLSPEYQNMLRERKTLSAALDTYNARAQEALVNAAQVQANNENIKIISQSEFAIKGQNTGKLIWAGGSLVWGLTLLMIALLIVFLNPKNFNAPAAGRKGPRRSRSTDGTMPNDDGNIPEPLTPYDPRTPIPATAIGGGAVEATRAYNASEATQAAHQPEEYSDEYRGVNYQGNTPYGNPQEYYPPAHNAGELSSSAHPQTNPQAPSPMAGQAYTPEYQANLAMQSNPYLNMQSQAGTHGGTFDQAYESGANSQTNGLPVLGSFSAARG